LKIISCVGAKGGSGKSSVALFLAWELSKNKNKVAILDADVQATCVSAKAMNSAMPFDVFAVANKKQLLEQSKILLNQGYSYVIIDGNPRSIHEDIDLITSIATLSDLSLIISRPTPRDLKAQIKYVDMVKSATMGQVRLLWNFYQKNTSAHKDGVPEGEKLLQLQSLKTMLCLRIAYQDIGFDECYIGAMNNKEATLEIKALSNEVRRIVDEIKESATQHATSRGISARC
jgi:cellulose biosynthesis protein BcsQ